MFTAIAAGAAVVGGAIAADAARDAAGTQAQAARDAAQLSSEASAQAVGENQRQFDISRNDLQPYREAGAAGMATLRDMLGMPSVSPRTRDQFLKTQADLLARHWGVKKVNGQYQFTPEQQALLNREVDNRMALQGQRGEMLHDVPFQGAGQMPGDAPLPSFNYPGYGQRTLRDMGRLAPGQDGVMVPSGESPWIKRGDSYMPNPAFSRDPNAPAWTDTSTASLPGGSYLPDAMDGGTGSRFGPTIPTFNYESQPFKFEADPGYDFRKAEGMRAVENSAAGRTGILSGNTIRALMELNQNMASDEYGRGYGRWLERDTTGYNRARDSYLTDIDLERQAYGRAGDEFNRNMTMAQIMDARNWRRYGQRYSEAEDAYARTTGARDARFNRIGSLVGIGQTATNTGASLGATNAANIGNITMSNAANIGNLMTQSSNAQAASRIAGANAISGGFQGAGNALMMNEWLNRMPRR